MGAPGTIPPEVQKIVSIMLYIIGALVGVVVISIMVVVALNIGKLTSWPAAFDVKAGLTIFAFCIALLCTIIWIMNQVGVLNLKRGTELMINTTLISALLTSFVIGIKNIFT